MLEQTLRVTSIRSQSPRGFGGCIFTGKPIDAQGNVQDAAAYYVVKATGPTLGKTLVQPGQWWKVAGEAAERFLEVNGFKVSEWQIDSFNAVLMRPSGEHIVSFMADNPAFVGIGQVKARKLWDDQMVLTGFHLGDPVLCTRNMWDRGLLVDVNYPDRSATTILAGGSGE